MGGAQTPTTTAYPGPTACLPTAPPNPPGPARPRPPPLRARLPQPPAAPAA
jgi:hypothetical protein